MKNVFAFAVVLTLLTLAACTQNANTPAANPTTTSQATETPVTPTQEPTTAPQPSPLPTLEPDATATSEPTEIPSSPTPTQTEPPEPTATLEPAEVSPTSTAEPISTPVPTSTAEPAAIALDKAIDGLGGPEALQTLSTLVINANILRYTTGEGPEPGFEPDEAIAISMLMAYVAGGDLRLDYARTGQGLEANYSEIISGYTGYMMGSDARFGGGEGANLTSDRAASSQKQQRLLNPHLILRDAMDNPSLASDGGTEEIDGVEHNLLIVQDEVFPIFLFIDSQTGTISRLVTMENDHWLRDVALEVNYFDWQASASDLMFPHKITIALEGVIVHEEMRSDIQVNIPLEASLFEFPEGANPVSNIELAEAGERSSQSIQMFSARGFPQQTLLTTVVPQEIAPGIFHIGGTSHNSLVVEQENGIVIAEAPLYPERSEAVIAWVEEQFPDKPITHIISSHHHRDHSSGLRAYAGRGIPMVMNERASEVFETIFSRPSTIVPDALANSSAEPVMELVPVDGTFEIPDAERPVTVVAIAPSHAADTVFTHVGGGNVVFGGDGGAQTPELIAALEELGLAATTYAGGHGQAAPYE